MLHFKKIKLYFSYTSELEGADEQRRVRKTVKSRAFLFFFLLILDPINILFVCKCERKKFGWLSKIFRTINSLVTGLFYLVNW